MARWDDCADELNQLLAWWSVELRSVRGAPLYRVVGRPHGGDRRLQMQGLPGEALGDLVARFRDHVQHRAGHRPGPSGAGAA